LAVQQDEYALSLRVAQYPLNAYLSGNGGISCGRLSHAVAGGLIDYREMLEPAYAWPVPCEMLHACMRHSVNPRQPIDIARAAQGCFGRVGHAMSRAFVQVSSCNVLLNSYGCPALSGFVQHQNPAGQTSQGVRSTLAVQVAGWLAVRHGMG